MMPLTYEENKSCKKQNTCYIYKKGFSTDDSNGIAPNKKYFKVKDYYYYYTGKYKGAAHNICNLRYKVPKEIPVLFHNGSTYDYHFIIKEMADQFERKF